MRDLESSLRARSLTAEMQTHRQASQEHSMQLTADSALTAPVTRGGCRRRRNACGCRMRCRDARSS